MKKMKELLRLQTVRSLKVMVFTLALVFSIGLFADGLSIVSHAESAGRIISASGANARSSASTSSEKVASYKQNEVISIRSQVKAADGYTWYEIHVDDQRIGYVRSDLVEITDGSTPPTSTQVTPSTPAPSGGNTNTVDVPANLIQLNPVSATVANGGTGGVRIRSNASTESKIITSVQNGAALTVTGQTTSQDGDGKTWYYVNFISNGTQVTGFIRSDFVVLSEDPTPYTEPTEEPDVPEETPIVDNTPPQPETPQDYELLYQDGAWKLAVYVTENQGTYDINQLLGVVSNNQNVYNDMESSIKGQKVAIVILVVLLVVAVGAVGFLIYKIKDMMDSAYFNEVERETLRRRSGPSGQGVMRNVGPEKRGSNQGQRPAGAPQGQRPSGAPQGQRPTGAPQGQRPTGTPQGQRPSGATQGQRPTGAPQGQRPAGAPQGQRPAGAPQGQRPNGAPQGQRPESSSDPKKDSGKSQPKNFMSDDDEFEFEFLNYEDDDKK